MKKISFIKSFAIAAVSLFVASCGSEEVVVPSLVPENAVFAAKLNVKSIYAKSLGDGSVEANAILEKIKGGIKNSGAPAAVEGMLLKAVQNPMAAFGFDFNQPVLFSMTFDGSIEEGGIYLTTGVSDKIVLKMIVDKLYEDAIEDYNYYLKWGEEEYGMYYKKPLKPSKSTLKNGVDFYFFGISAENSLCCALSEKFMICYASASSLGENGVNGQEAIKKLLAQSGTCTGPCFDEFISSPSDAAIWMNYGAVYDNIVSEIKNRDRNAYRNMKQFENLYKGMSMIADLDFKPGKTVMTIKADGSEEMKTYAQTYMAKPTDVLFSKIPASSVLAANFAISTDALSEVWKELSNNGMIAEYVDLLRNQFGVDSDFISGLPGTITAGVSVTDEGDPVASLAIECDRRVYDLVMPLLVEYSGMVESDGDGTYSIYQVEDDYGYYDYGYSPVKTCLAFVTYSNGAAVVMTPNLWYESNGGKYLRDNYASSSTADYLEKGGFVLNLNALPKRVLYELINELSRGANIRPDELLDLVSSVTLTSPEALTAELSINMGDQSQSLLRKLVVFVSEML